MAIRKMKAMTNGTRHMSRLVNEDLDNVRPEKSLTVPLKSATGTELVETDKKDTKDFTELSTSKEIN